MTEIKVGVLGLGTVGTGVVKMLIKNSEIIEERVGCSIKIEKILEKNPEIVKSSSLEDISNLVTYKPEEVLDNPDIDIIVEVIGGIEPAKSFILLALNNGKSVVTANKDLIALHGKDLFEAAAENNCDLLYEASVAGGIPILRPLKECLAGNRISKIMGIVNGTTNYILTKMIYEGISFNDALAEAQELGYAESDPTNDIEGYDAARKIAILASLAFGYRITDKDVYVEGIKNITLSDIEYAEDLGYSIKLLGIACEEDNEIEAKVYPVFISKEHPLSAVKDSFNAIFIEGDAVDEVMFYGRGAGELPTASAVLGDIISLSRDILKGVSWRIKDFSSSNKKVRPIEKTISEFYFRLQVIDRPGVMATIAGVFGDQDVSLASVVQKKSFGAKAEIVLITHKVEEEKVNKALNIIRELPILDEISSVIRVEGGKT